MNFLVPEIDNIIKSEKTLSNFFKNSVEQDLPFFKHCGELRELLGLYNDNEHFLCMVEGSFGTFKTGLVNASLKLLEPEVLVFKFSCFEATTLDDMFLSFFNDLKKFHQEKKISFSKIETNSLSQKINQYLTRLNRPAVIVIDSFENIFSSQKNKDEIARFLDHLLSFNQFKIVVLSRIVENNLFQSQNQLRITLQPFTKEEIGKYYDALFIKAEPEEIDSLYEATRGNTNYIAMSANIILTLKISLKSLLDDFQKKKITYEDFILQKLCAYVPDTIKKSMSILTMIKSGLTREFLLNGGFFTKEQLNYLIEKEVICEEEGTVFLKSYLKEYLVSGISHFEKIKIHQYLKKYYEAQLPLKPNQRLTPLSRTTMREQIAYHESFLLNENRKENVDMSYLGYVSGNLTEWTMEDLRKEEKKPSQTKELSKKPVSKMEKYELTKEELVLLGLPIDFSFEGSAPQRQEEQEATEENLNMDELIEKALGLQNNHEYADALEIYKSALKKAQDPFYKKYLVKLFECCAQCSKKLNNIDDAIKYTDMLYDYYYEHNETENANCVLLEIAKINKDAYRFLKAKEVYERFITSKLPISEFVLAHAYIGLAQIEEDSSEIEKAAQNYKKAFDFSQNLEDKSFLSDAYFKYALILDDENATYEALGYYEQSALANPNPATNTYLSSAYTNIAQICKEKGDLTKAFKNYRVALKYDCELFNYEGIYYLCTKLASLCEKIKPELVLNYLLKALSASKRLGDKFYITKCYLEIADYYEKSSNSQKALKAYLYAKQLLSEQESRSDDLNKTEAKINSIKNRMDKRTFDTITEGFNNNAI